MKTGGQAKIPDAFKKSFLVSRTASIGYFLCAFLGFFGLLYERSFASWATAFALLLIAVGEWHLGSRLKRTARNHWVRWLSWHQVWILILGITLLLFWANLDLTPYLAQIPEPLWNLLTVQTEQLGLTPEGYMKVVWKVALVLVGFIFVGQQIWIFRVHRQVLRSVDPEV